MLLLAIPLPVLNISFVTTIIIIFTFVLLLVEGDFPYLFAIILLFELLFTGVIIDGLNN